MTFRAHTACIATLCALSAALLVAQGRSSKTPLIWPGTASFRCAPAGCTPAVIPLDGIQGDGSNYAFVEQDGGHTAGAGAYPGGDLHIQLGQPSRYAIQLDFTRPDQNHNGCSPYPVVPQDCFPWADQLLTLTTGTEVQARLTDEHGVDLGIGLESMPAGSTAFARVRFDFRMLVGGVNQLWRVRFNKLDYAGSSDLTIRRVNGLPCTWVMTALEDDLAGVWTEKTIGKKKGVRLDYGLYSMPFQLTLNLFDAPGCPARNW